MKLGSLCAGIGGLELGLERALGCETIWQVEFEPHLRAVLGTHWPNAERFDDVQASGGNFVWRNVLKPVDIICFGSPCQDISSAGKRVGLSGPKSRLFYECCRIVSELRPEWVVVENVASGASRWVDAARQELEERGYASLPVPIAASDCGAPHRRSRIFLVAHADRQHLLQQSGGGSRANRQGPLLGRATGEAGGRPPESRAHSNAYSGRQPLGSQHEEAAVTPESADTCDCGHHRDEHGGGWGAAREWCGECSCTRFQPRPPSYSDGELGNSRESQSRKERTGRPKSAGSATADALRARREGSGPGAHQGGLRSAPSGWWAPQPDILRVVHGVPRGLDRARDRIAALGNSCTPQQAEVPGHVIRILIEAERRRVA